MATREHRLAEFSTTAPTMGASHELLCEDHAGTYALPYPCQWSGREWLNVGTSSPIEARVIGWRPW